MDIAQEKICLHCGNKFIPIRETRRYCSNSCKQMGYKKRNETVGDIEPPVTVNFQPFIDDKTTLSVNSVDDNSTKTNELTVNNRNIEPSTNSFIVNSETIVDDKNIFSVNTIDDKVSIPNAFNVNEQPTIDVNLRETDNFSVNNARKVDDKKDFTVNEIDDNSSVKDNVPSGNPLIIDGKEKTTDKKMQELKLPLSHEPPLTAKTENKYQYIACAFTRLIDNYINDGWQRQIMFKTPTAYWSNGTIERINWVSPRLRCLVESLVKLSNHLTIDRQSLIAITYSFVKLTEAKKFKELPRNYPYISLVLELREQLLKILSETNGQHLIRFRIKPDKKAFLIVVKYELHPYTKNIKFSELTFDE